MNLFYLHHDPQLCAQSHCDKHVVKMIVEYAQLLSTAHRLLDGKQVSFAIKEGKLKKAWLLPGETITMFPDEDAGKINNQQLYKVTHANHPTNVWVRESVGNYDFLYTLLRALCVEYSKRYGKVHATASKLPLLSKAPKNIPQGEFVDPPLAMPDEYKANDAVISYQNLYVGSKARFAVWTNRQPPEWFITRIPNYDQTNFTRTRAMAA